MLKATVPMYKNAILLALFILSLVQILPAANPDFYFYRDKKIPLVRDATRVYIELPGGLASRPALSRDLNRLEKFDRAEKNRFLFEAKNDAAIRAKTTGLPENAKLYPVFKDPQTGLQVFIFNEIAVQIQSTAGEQEILTWLASKKINLLRKDPLRTDIWLLKANVPSEHFLKLTNELAKNKNYFVWAEPNLYPEMQKNFTPNDTFFNQQWHLKNTGQNNGVAGADLDMEAAWEITQGDPGIVIAVLDDGLDMDHEDIAPNLFLNPAEIIDGIDNDNNGFIDDISGWDFCDGDNNPRHILFNTERHGTATAGIAAARGNNSVGVSGVAPQSRVFSCKIFKGDNFCGNFEAAAAIRFAAQFADVISNSWGGGSASAVFESALIDAKLNGRNGLGCVIYFSTGNEFSNSVAFPARFPWVIAIGASNRQDQRETFSNFGPTTNLLAPTANFTTDRTGTEFGYTLFDPAGNYTAGFGGTSAACPAAAGVGALMLAHNPNLTADQVLAIQQNSAEKINPFVANYNTFGQSLEYGHGRINAHQALLDTPTTHTNIDDAYEDDDTSVTAKPIANTLLNGLIALDEDWFVTTLTPGMELTASIDFIDAQIDLRLELYNSSGTLLVASDTNENSEKIQYLEALTSGPATTLYLRVASDNYAPYGYQIKVNEREEDDALEQNDVFGDATLLTDGQYLDLKAFDDDYYRVNVQPGEGIIFDVTFEHSAGDIDVLVFDQDGEELTESASANNNERVNIAGNPNITAFVFHVFGFADATNEYSLKVRKRFITEDALEDNDSIVSPIDLQNGVYNLTSLDAEWFRVRVDELSPINVRIDFVNEFGDLDLQLFNASTVLNDSSLSATNDFEEVSSFAVINNDLFLIHVLAVGDVINTYTLTVENSLPADDSFEENDTIMTATNLSPGFYENLILNDEDYFKITVPQNQALQFKTFFFNTIGDLQMELLDSNLQQIDQSLSTSDTEVFQVYNSQSAPQDFFLKVFGEGGVTNPNYKLEAILAEDQFENNDQFADAKQIYPGIYFNQLLLDEDWYFFNAEVGDSLVAAVTFEQSKGNILFQLYDSSMQLLQEAQTGEQFDFISMKINETQNYYLRASGDDDLNFYRLTLQLLGTESNKSFFAEGSTVGDFNTYILLANPNNSFARVAARYLRRSKTPVLQELILPPFSRTTINAQTVIPDNWFGLELDPKNGEKIYAERALYWSVDSVFRAGGSATIAANGARSEWFFAEGTTTSNRETDLLVTNPVDTSIEVEVTYFVQNAQPVMVSYGVPANQQIKIITQDDVPNSDFSMKIKSNNGTEFIAERTLFFPDTATQKTGGHTSIPTSPTSTWYFAEGATSNNEETFYLLANPNSTTQNIRINYYTEKSEVFTEEVAVSPMQRLTVKANNLLTTSTHSVKIESLDGSKFIAERAMYFRDEAHVRIGGSATIGTPEPATEWFFAEGRTGGVSNFSEVIALGNPGSSDAEIEIRFVTDQLESIFQTITVPANSRRSVFVHEINGLEDTSVSAFVTSTNQIPIVAERTMVWTQPGGDTAIELHTTIGFNP